MIHSEITFDPPLSFLMTLLKFLASILSKWKKYIWKKSKKYKNMWVWNAVVMCFHFGTSQGTKGLLSRNHCCSTATCKGPQQVTLAESHQTTLLSALFQLCSSPFHQASYRDHLSLAFLQPEVSSLLQRKG